MAKEQYEITIATAADEFAVVATEGGPRFPQEQAFALAILAENDALANTAKANPASLVRAMLRLAGTGLSLNPALAYAYLVPRDRKVCLDIGYRGLIKIHTDAGVIDSIHVDTVYSGDEWEHEERDEGPHLLHRRPRLGAPRGTLEGAYVRAVLPSGRVVVTTMTLEEYNAVKRMSALGRKDSGPHADWTDEMMKAKVIKRASKTWPKADIHGAQAAALEIAEAAADDDARVGADDAENITPDGGVTFVTQDQAEMVDAACVQAGITFAGFCKAFEIGCLEELPADRYDEAMARLEQKVKDNFTNQDRV